MESALRRGTNSKGASIAARYSSCHPQDRRKKTLIGIADQGFGEHENQRTAGSQFSVLI
jgi:hypothetical protein